jgi:hypothetical protein
MRITPLIPVSSTKLMWVPSQVGDMAGDDERAVVKTYVPRYQKEAWVEHAEELDMSQSEFVRTMVQAGRSDLALDPPEQESPDATPGGDGLEDRVLALLREADYLAWDELLARLTGDIEDRLDDALADLQAENLVQYSGRRGGYTVVGEGPSTDRPSRGGSENPPRERSGRPRSRDGRRAPDDSPPAERGDRRDSGGRGRDAGRDRGRERRPGRGERDGR